MKDRKDFWVPWFIVWITGILFIFGVCAFAYFLCDSPDCNHRFLVFKIAIQIFIVATAIAWLICHFIDYDNMNKANDNTVRMKFNHFKDVYYINPDRWYLKNGKLLYKNGKDYWHQELYYVTFTYFDWLKFLFWNKFREYEEKLELKREKKQESNERLAEMLKYIQNDINEAYEKINKE